MRFFIVDVFGQTKYSGNQLAVVFTDGLLSDKEMQSIAFEFNFSETTFVNTKSSGDGNRFDVRIFTPVAELPFAGHPTLGTAYIIYEYLLSKKINDIVLNLKVGDIPVTINDRVTPPLIRMKQPKPEFGQMYEPAKIAPVLGLDVSDIDSRFPIETVSTGVPIIIVPITDLKALKKARVDIPVFNKQFGVDSKTIFYIFSPDTYDKAHDLNARMFAHPIGIIEDPATGGAVGPLAGYLLKNKYFGKAPVSKIVEQGYEVNRPSLLFIDSEYDEKGDIIIHVAGNVIKIAQGDLF